MNTTRPHDPTDLMLAPAALAIDNRLQELSGLSHTELDERIAWETNSAPRTREGAERAILDDLAYLTPTHGWDLVWDVRGIRLQHRDHTLVLGVPDNLTRWVASVGSTTVTAG